MERRPSSIATVVVVMLSLSSCCASSSAGGGGGGQQQLHPVILIPGSGGNQLEARLTEEYRPSSLACRVWPLVRGRGGWFRLWFEPSVLVAPLTRCFAERMMLYYDRDADDYRNAPGVETRVSDFGSTSSLRYLDPNLKLLTGYMDALASTLEKAAGYEEGRDLFGAPYDFRYGLAAPGHTSQVGSAYLERLRLLVESAFLLGQERDAVPTDIGFADGVEPYRARIRPLGEVLPEPGVPVTCLVGTGVYTVENLVFGQEGFEAGPVEVVYGDGDGTVNLASLVGPIKAWSDSPAQVLEVVELPKVSHSAILRTGARSSYHSS